MFGKRRVKKKHVYLISWTANVINPVGVQTISYGHGYFFKQTKVTSHFDVEVMAAEFKSQEKVDNLVVLNLIYLGKEEEPLKKPGAEE